MIGALRSNLAIPVVALLALYAVGLVIFQADLLLDTTQQHEEARLLFRYYQFQDPALFPGDYLASFLNAFDQPLLYDWLTRLWIASGGDLVVLHRVIPLLCWLAFLAGLVVAARRLGGWLTVVGVVCLAVAQPVYLYQITSALPHAFAFPLLAWAFVGLLAGSTWSLVAIALLSGLLYPALAPLTGMLLVWQAVFVERLWAAPGAIRLTRALVILATGAICLWLLFGALIGPTEFGAGLAPTQNADVYPENGPEGRHFYGVFNPFKYVAAKAFVQFNVFFENYRLLLLLVYVLVSIYGFVALPRGSAGRRSVLGFVLCSAVIYGLALAAKPFMVYRFILYPAFTLLPLLFVVGLLGFCNRFAGVLRAPQLAAAVVLALMVMTLDSFDTKKLGYWWHLDENTTAIVDFVAEQPPETLVAVWPGENQELELLPYLARRALFVSYKAHYPGYEAHILEMRARMTALIDAYLASGQAPLRDLYCRWGVDFLVVEKAHFQADGPRPAYFAPFDAEIERIWSAQRSTGFLLADPPAAAAALATDSRIVVDLSALVGAEATGCAHGLPPVAQN